MTDKKFLKKLKEIVSVSDNMSEKERDDAISNVMKLVDDYWESEDGR